MKEIDGSNNLDSSYSEHMTFYEVSKPFLVRLSDRAIDCKKIRDQVLEAVHEVIHILKHLFFDEEDQKREVNRIHEPANVQFVTPTLLKHKKRS